MAAGIVLGTERRRPGLGSLAARGAEGRRESSSPNFAGHVLAGWGSAAWDPAVRRRFGGRGLEVTTEYGRRPHLPHGARRPLGSGPKPGALPHHLRPPAAQTA